MNEFNTFPTQYRHIEDMHERVCAKNINFDKKSNENLDNFSLICIDSVFIGGSTPTTAFDELVQYFIYII